MIGMILRASCSNVEIEIESVLTHFSHSIVKLPFTFHLSPCTATMYIKCFFS